MTIPIYNVPHGSVKRDTPEFAILSTYTRNYLASIGFDKRKSDGFLRRLWRTLKLNGLAERLAPYGWSFDDSGEMFRIRVHDSDSRAVASDRRRESDDDIVRETIINTGYVVDPATGRKAPPHQRHRWAI
jgi:hypothetical protein